MLVIAASLALASLGAASAATPTVSHFKIKPSPFYSDEPFLFVTFTTAAAAPAGRLYFVHWQARGAPSSMTPGCSPLSKVDSIGYKGGTNARVTARLTTETLFGDAFCPGPSRVYVYTQLANSKRYERTGATKSTGHIVGQFDFRVQRP